MLVGAALALVGIEPVVLNDALHRFALVCSLEIALYVRLHNCNRLLIPKRGVHGIAMYCSDAKPVRNVGNAAVII